MLVRRRDESARKWDARRYCGALCHDAARRRRVVVQCAACGIDIERHPGELRKLDERGQRAYCSRECRTRIRPYTCQACGAAFAIRPSQRSGRYVLCSDECRQRITRQAWCFLPAFAGKSYTVRLQLAGMSDLPDDLSGEIEWAVVSERDRYGLQLAIADGVLGPVRVVEVAHD